MTENQKMHVHKTDLYGSELLKHKNELPSCLTFLYHTLPYQTTISCAIFAGLPFLEASEPPML